MTGDGKLEFIAFPSVHALGVEFVSRASWQLKPHSFFRALGWQATRVGAALFGLLFTDAARKRRATSQREGALAAGLPSPQRRHASVLPGALRDSGCCCCGAARYSLYISFLEGMVSRARRRQGLRPRKQSGNCRASPAGCLWYRWTESSSKLDMWQTFQSLTIAR